MKLPSNKIESVASNQESRYCLRAVQLDVEKKRIMATDGHILAIVPCEVDAEDHSALIGLDTVKSLRAMQKRSKVHGTSIPVQIRTNGKITATAMGESAEFAVAEGRFPNVDMIVKEVEGPPTVSLSVELLYKLAEALHSNSIGSSNPGHVSLWVKDASSAVVVKSTQSEDKGAVGVIMPVRA